MPLALSSLGNVWVATAITLAAGLATVALLLRARRPAKRTRNVAPLHVPPADALSALPGSFEACPACGGVELHESRIIRSSQYLVPMECARCAWEGRPPVFTRDEYAAFVASLTSRRS